MTLIRQKRVSTLCSASKLQTKWPQNVCDFATLHHCREKLHKNTGGDTLNAQASISAFHPHPRTTPHHAHTHTTRHTTAQQYHSQMRANWEDSWTRRDELYNSNRGEVGARGMSHSYADGITLYLKPELIDLKWRPIVLEPRCKIYEECVQTRQRELLQRLLRI